MMNDPCPINTVSYNFYCPYMFFPYIFHVPSSFHTSLQKRANTPQQRFFRKFQWFLENPEALKTRRGRFARHRLYIFSFSWFCNTNSNIRTAVFFPAKPSPFPFWVFSTIIRATILFETLQLVGLDMFRLSDSSRSSWTRVTSDWLPRFFPINNSPSLVNKLRGYLSLICLGAS